MCRSMLAILGFILMSNTAVAEECNPKAIEQEIADTFGSRIASAGGVCASANVQIEMLEYAKNSYRACLRGKSLNDVITELDRIIDRAEQAKRDVGGC